MKKFAFLILLLPLTLTWSSQELGLKICHDSLESLPIQQNGRIKPLYVHAKETMKFLTKKKSFQGHSPVIAYCLLSLEGLGIENNLQIATPVEHKDSKELLNLTDDQSEIKIEDLSVFKSDIRLAINRIKIENGYQKELKRLLSKIHLHQDITTGQNWMLPSFGPGDEVFWQPLTSFLTEEKFLEKKEQGTAAFQTIFEEAHDKYQQKAGTKHLLEFKFRKMKLPTIALITTLIALMTLTLFKKFTLSLIFSFLTVILQTAIITIRIMISGRAPITNMYETVMFSGFGALVLALIIGHYRKEKTFVYMGLAYNLCTLMMINFADGMLSESISPLVPVLRDNFWLSTHVTMIIISYGALALSWVLANTVLIRKKFITLTSQDERYYSDLIYTCLKYGTVLLAGGIILGGVWADYSWGRFWGWDPKETWSLIALCIYMAILHGRYTSWIPNSRFIPLTAAAFMSIMMAWFGVNYILAAGLHSYGFSEGGAVFLGSFFLIQTLLIIMTTTNKKSSSQTA